MNRKILILFGIATIIAVAAIALGGFSVYQYFLSQKDQTANWKTYDWTIGKETISFQYPNGWTVEKEYYSTPAEQLAGTSENVGLFIYPTNDKQNNIHIDGRQNSCNDNPSYTRCITTSGHIIAINSKNSDISQFNKILSTLKFGVSSNKSASDFCNTQKVSQSSIDDCLEKAAVGENDISICDLMSGTIDTYGSLSAYQKNRCYEKIAVATKSFEICDSKLKNDPMCYKGVAVATGNVSMCNKVQEGGGYRNACYIDLAESKKDLSICYKIKNTIGTAKGESWQTQGQNGEAINYWESEQCYEKVAVAKKDISICDLIKNRYDSLTYCISKTKDINFDTVSLDASTWSDYKNDKYGLEFKYPKEITVIDRINHQNDLLSIVLADIEFDFGISATPKNNFSFGSPSSPETIYYDENNNKWMENNGWGVVKPIDCHNKEAYLDFTTIGEEKIIAFRQGTSYAIITNKDFALRINTHSYVNFDGSSDAELRAAQKISDIEDKIVNSLKLIGDIKAINPTNCN